MLAVNEEGLHYMTFDHLIMKSWMYAELNSWASSSEHFGFVVGVVEDPQEIHRLVFTTTKVMRISTARSVYRLLWIIGGGYNVVGAGVH